MGLREIVIADLERACRLIERRGAELDPQFRIASPEGVWAIAITLSSDERERARQFALVSRFMAWKVAPAFTQAGEIGDPDAVICVGVSHSEVIGVLSLIERGPMRFGPPQWLAREALGSDIPGLLPRGRVELSDAEIAELKAYFGPKGPFPAVRIATGEIGA